MNANDFKTYRVFLEPVHELSPVNRSRVMSGEHRQQTTEALQWHTGDDTRGLSDYWLSKLEDGDYIILVGEFTHVAKRDAFEANTELLG